MRHTLCMTKKIMIVDDDKEFVEELEETLTLSGYEVVAVNDPVSSLSTAIVEKPHLVLLDLKMDGMSGFRVAEGLRQHLGTTHIPIIAMTGYFTGDEHILLMHMCGIEQCLKKPFNPLDIITKIESELNKKEK